jgi:hypothetical protein
VYGGSAPGTPVNGSEFGVDVGPDEFEGGLLLAVLDPGVDRVKYSAEPTAAPSTTRMIMKGNVRFIG